MTDETTTQLHRTIPVAPTLGTADVETGPER
jgi:hypothetical protein